MKHIAIILFTFCILLLTGCRTSKFVQKEDITTETRQESLERSLVRLCKDSLNHQLTLSIDSLSFELSLSDTDTAINSSRQKRPVRLKAYGVHLNSTKEKKYTNLSASKEKDTTTIHSEKAKTHFSQKAKSRVNSFWIFVCIMLFFLFYKMYRLRA